METLFFNAFSKVSNRCQVSDQRGYRVHVDRFISNSNLRSCNIGGEKKRRIPGHTLKGLSISINYYTVHCVNPKILEICTPTG
jgi:hypothetical protein